MADLGRKEKGRFGATTGRKLPLAPQQASRDARRSFASLVDFLEEVFA
jgi:hypothetical protein